MVKKTKELITKQATVIAKRADEHEDFITKVVSFETIPFAFQWLMLQMISMLIF